MAKNLVLVGGGHAHLVTLAKLEAFRERGHVVTVVQPSENHYYSGMGPGMLGTTYTPEEIRFATRQVVEQKGGVFIQDLVDRIDPVARTVFLRSGRTLPYDVLSFNSGSYVPQTCVTQDKGDIFSVKPIEKLLQARERIVEWADQEVISIGIVGGGHPPLR